MSLERNRGYLKKYYSEVPYESNISRDYYPNSNEDLFEKIIREMLRLLKVDLGREYSFERERKAFYSLVEKGYIEDPIFTSVFGISIAISGFIPYGFTCQTKKGQTIYRKIQAVFWSYEKDSRKKDSVTTNINFRLWKVLTAFKKALAEDTNEEIKK